MAKTHPNTEQEDTDFRIVSQAFDSWNVQFNINVAELLDKQALLMHLRKIKRSIAKEQSISERSMLFDGIIRKTERDDQVDVVVRIKRQRFEKGNPRVNFRDGTSPDGTQYTHMSALLDLFYHDEFDRPIMLDKVMQAVTEGGISTELLDQEIITRRLKEVLERQFPIKDIPIAHGRYPAAGQDAEIEFFFPAVAEPGETEEYYSSRRVHKGDLLCRKTPAAAGKTSGLNVLGQTLPPRPGMDIRLKAGSGTVLSLDENEAVADDNGVVVVHRKMQRLNTVQGVKEIPEEIVVKVNPVLRIEGDKVLDIASNKTVEVIGDLTLGSRILTDCEVYVEGNVDEGSVIEAGDNVTVQGDVRGASIKSDNHVIASGEIESSEIAAKDSIIIKGKVRNSSLTGDSVTAESISGTKIVSRQKVILDRIDADENDVLSTICVGMYDFFKQRIRENEIFIEKAYENLFRIELLVGREILEAVNDSNIQPMLMRVLAKMRHNRDPVSKSQVDVYRKLLESVPPTRELVAQKKEEIIELQKRIADKETEEENVIVVRERMASRSVVSINGVEAEIPAAESSARIRSHGSGSLEVKFPKPGEDADCSETQ